MNVQDIFKTALHCAAQAHHLTVSCRYGREPTSPRSTPWGAYRSASHFVQHTFYNNCLQCCHTYTHSFMVDRNTVVGHVPTVHVFFYVHQSHKRDSTHPSLFTSCTWGVSIHSAPQWFRITRRHPLNKLQLCTSRPAWHTGSALPWYATGCWFMRWSGNSPFPYSDSDGSVST